MTAVTGRIVIVMAKKPVAGQAKTRLCPPLTDDEAARLADAFVADAVALVRRVENATAAVAVWPPTATDYFARRTPGLVQLRQEGGSLAVRLEGVMTEASERGFGSVVAIGADSPTLPPEEITRAFDLLESGRGDVVFGPAEDGGYYLVGWRTPVPSVISSVQMSTPTVLSETVERARTMQLGVALTSWWYDVDTPGDLRRLAAELATAPAGVAAETRQVLAPLAERLCLE